MRQTCRNNTAPRRQSTFTAQLPNADYTPPPTATDTQTIQQQSKHNPSDSHPISAQAKADSTGESAVPGWSRGWGKRRRRDDQRDQRPETRDQRDDERRPSEASTAREFRVQFGLGVETRTSIRLRQRPSPRLRIETYIFVS